MYSIHRAEIEKFIKELSSINFREVIANVSEPYDILRNFKSTWPNNELPGVYLFLSDSWDLLYIGESNELGTRLRKHFRYAANKKMGEPKTDEAKGTRFVITIGLKVDYGILAPALEKFLIKALHPQFNKIGKESHLNST